MAAHSVHSLSHRLSVAYAHKSYDILTAAAVFIRRVSHLVISLLASLVIDVFARAFELASVNLTLGITVEFFAGKESKSLRETLFDFRENSTIF